jgi:peptide/nickel transport system permease protein
VTNFKFLMGQLSKNPLSLAGLVIVVIFIVIAIFAPLIAPTQPQQQSAYLIPEDGYSSTPRPPGSPVNNGQLSTSTHLFGTTELQFDIFYGVIWGARSAFRVALIVMASALLIGITLGSLAGYFGGILDEIIMRITDIFLSFPALILAMALLIALGASLNSIIIALTIVWWPAYARLIRGDILQLREEDYIEASRGLGASSRRMILRHVLPNAIYPALIMASLDIGAVVLVAAALSFLGLGPGAGYADWGQMIGFSRNWIIGPPGHPLAYWYTVLIPGGFIVFFVLGWNLLGDAFRDIFDPRLARR